MNRPPARRPRAATRRAGFAVAGAVAWSAAAGAMAALGAQEARIRTEADTSLITVGDRIHLTLTVEHATDQRVAWPDSIDVAPFEVLGGEALAPVAEGDRVRSGVRLTMTAFELGDLEIPGIPVGVVSPDGTVETLVSDGWRVTVSSVGLDEEGDIRGIVGPLGIPFDVVVIVPWLLLVALALALFVWWLRRRRRRGPAPPPPPPPAPRRPPHEVALEALAALEASDLLQRGEVKEYHVRVSDIVRAYVEALYRVPALEMTTGEVLAVLDRVGVHGEPVAQLRRFLERCDLVKFAKLLPSADESRAMLALARGFVEETRTRVGEAMRPDPEGDAGGGRADAPSAARGEAGEADGASAGAAEADGALEDAVEAGGAATDAPPPPRGDA